jgi:Bacteriophage HK97-gp10, putative tail-component
MAQSSRYTIGKGARGAIVVIGIPEIDRKLRLLEPRVQKRVVRQAMRTGLKIIKREVESQVPVDTGLTKRNVKLRAVKKKKRGTIELEVLISGKETGLTVHPRHGKPVFYPAVVEYKHNPFMRRSYTAKGEQARLVTIEALKRGVDDQVRAL